MKENLSALFDGDLDAKPLQAVLDEVCCDPDWRRDWTIYCLIGDCLSGDNPCSPQFVEDVMAAIETDESMVVAKPSIVVQTAAVGAANEKSFWPSLMPLAASFAGVTAVALVAFFMYQHDTPTAVVVRAEVDQLPALQEASALAPDHLLRQRQYQLVHQLMAGKGTIIGPVPNVRTVSDKQGERRR